MKEKQGAALGILLSRVRTSIAVLMTLIFSKFVYLASFTSLYPFSLMHHFHISLRSAQMHLFALADATSIEDVYRVVAFLPALGVLAPLLPTFGRESAAA